MPILSTTVGSENGKGWSAKAHAFLMAGEGCPTQTEVHLGKAVRLLPGVVSRVSSGGTYPAIQNTIPEIGGKWSDVSYELPEGTYIKLWFDSKVAFGSMPIRVAAIFKMRQNAAYRKVSFFLPGTPQSTKTKIDCTGRMDRVTLDEALALGLKVPTTFRHFYEEHEVRDCLEITVLEEARVDKPKVDVVEVETESGEVKKVIKARRRRKLKL